MGYIFNTDKQRSLLMSRIKSSETKAEVTLRKALWQRGIRYRKNLNYLPGKPDIVLTKHNIAVFIDGDFWHGYNWKEKRSRIRRNREYWIPKIEKNIKRDLEVNDALKKLGYTVIRLWEKEVKADLAGCVLIILSEINEK